MLHVAFHLSFPASASSAVRGTGLRARVQSLAHLCSTAEKDEERLKDSTELKGTIEGSSAQSYSFCFGASLAELLPYIPLQSIQGIQLFVHLLKSSLFLWAEMSRPGPVPHDTKQASTALGSPAQRSGLGGAASYPERAGSFPRNEID